MAIQFKDILDTVLTEEHLDIYEKMCLIILLSTEEELQLTSEMLGNYMGCSTVRAKLAFDSLYKKGYLKGESVYYEAEPVVKRESNVLSPSREAVEVADLRAAVTFESEEFVEGFFKTEKPVPVKGFEAMIMPTQQRSERSQEEERRQKLAEYLMGGDDFVIDDVKPFVSTKETKESLVDQVIHIIEEKISFKEANIILGFAGNDLDLIKRKYKIAKMSQMSDTISVLINELQKKESSVIKSEEVELDNSQINTNRILKMQAYKNQKR